MKTHRRLPGRRGRRGGVLILFGLTLVVLLGFAGLVIDLGRFFVIRAELQNAMDACATAAASQLRPGDNDANALSRAVAYGRVFSTGGVATPELPGFPLAAIQNKANFQSAPVDIQSEHISFSATLGGTYNTAGSADTNTARYAKCDYPLTGMPIYFMRVLNLLGASFNTQTVSAMATATRGSQVCNVIAVGICQRSAAADRGLSKGNWYTPSDNPEDVSGLNFYFGWMDYSPKAGGAKELVGQLTDVGRCGFIGDIVGTVVIEPGRKTAAERGWNTRFGVYKSGGGGFDTTTAPPDNTGYAYYGTDEPGVVQNWPRDRNATTPRAYDQGTGNFKQAQASFDPFQYSAPNVKFSPPADSSSSSQHRLDGRKDRRLVITPVLNCNKASPPYDVTALGCSLMLNPFSDAKTGKGYDPVPGKLEYLGLVGDPGNPCGEDITIPLMSVLVK